MILQNVCNFIKERVSLCEEEFQGCSTTFKLTKCLSPLVIYLNVYNPELLEKYIEWSKKNE